MALARSLPKLGSAFLGTGIEQNGLLHRLDLDRVEPMYHLTWGQADCHPFLHSVIESLKQFTEEYVIPYQSQLNFHNAQGLQFVPFEYLLTLCIREWEEPLAVGCLCELWTCKHFCQVTLYWLSSMSLTTNADLTVFNKPLEPKSIATVIKISLEKWAQGFSIQEIIAI